MKFKKLAPLPLLKKKQVTALELLQHVVKLEQKEPKRLYMGLVVASFRAEVNDHLLPSCGTVCCHAGWIDVLTDPFAALSSVGRDYPGKQIGLICGTEDGGMADALDECFNTFPGNRRGTVRYVREAQEPLLAFMKKYRKQLSQRIITIRARS